jgi:hypothetical protein
MHESPELVTDANGRPDPDKFTDALDAASDQDRITWITDPDGRRIAALVPAEVAQYHEDMLSRVLSEPRGRRHRQAEPAQS